MEQLPFYLPAAFIGTTALTFYFLYKASPSKKWIVFVFLWLLVHSLLALNGFYSATHILPPRLFIFLVGPAFLIITALFFSAKGKIWMDTLDLKWLTYLHTIRIPVELVLYGLYLHKMIPEIMTFEGHNPDILSGITAPVIGYLAFSTSRLSQKMVCLWNGICLILLINIVAHAISSAPFPFQQFGLDQPNIAIFYFPFVLLPGFIVPVVLFAHLESIRRCLK